MEFTDEELVAIFTVFEINVQALEQKKGHKSKKDILAINRMKKIVEKIEKYKEEKENEKSK